MAEVRTNAESELRKRIQSMSLKERTKLNNLIRNIEFLGDVGKAKASRARDSYRKSATVMSYFHTSVVLGPGWSPRKPPASQKTG